MVKRNIEGEGFRKKTSTSKGRREKRMRNKQANIIMMTMLRITMTMLRITMTMLRITMTMMITMTTMMTMMTTSENHSRINNNKEFDHNDDNNKKGSLPMTMKKQNTKTKLNLLESVDDCSS